MKINNAATYPEWLRSNGSVVKLDGSGFQMPKCKIKYM